MTKPDFDTTWVPRIGEPAASELRHFRSIGLIVATVVPVIAVAAGLLFAVGGLGDLLGTMLVVALAVSIALFIRAQMKLASAMSEWFGVKIRGGQIPKMNQIRFDTWCEARGLHHPSGQASGAQDAISSDVAPRRS
jgi:hypothetical protein